MVDAAVAQGMSVLGDRLAAERVGQGARGGWGREDGRGAIGGSKGGQQLKGFKVRRRMAVVQRGQGRLLGHGFFGL